MIINQYRLKRCKTGVYLAGGLILISLQTALGAPAAHAGNAAAETVDQTTQVGAASPPAPDDRSGGVIRAAYAAVDDMVPSPGLQQSQIGMGRADSAMDELDIALGQRQVFSDLRTLQDRISDMTRPVTNVDARQSSQSNHLDITQFELSQDFFFSDGRSRLRGGLQSITYSPQTGDRLIQKSIGGNGNYRINDWSAITGELWINSYQNNQIPSSTLPTYDVFFTVWPSDLVRLDLDANRRTFDNILSLQKGITGSAFNGSFDFTPSDNMRLTFRGGDVSYSDGNNQRTAEVEAIWRVKAQPSVQIGVRGSGFEFSRLLANGYFNPKSYVTGEGMVRVQAKATDKLTVEFVGSAGVERADPGGVKPLVKASLQTSYQIQKDWSLDAGVAYFSSRDASSAGFARTSFTLGVHRKFG